MLSVTAIQRIRTVPNTIWGTVTICCIHHPVAVIVDTVSAVLFLSGVRVCVVVVTVGFEVGTVLAFLEPVSIIVIVDALTARAFLKVYRSITVIIQSVCAGRISQRPFLSTRVHLCVVIITVRLGIGAVLTHRKPISVTVIVDAFTASAVRFIHISVAIVVQPI
jgi:hypothetical protein